jgi:hypothetical protein
VVTRKSKSKRGKDKDSNRATPADDGAAEIARAERKLANALANVEAARDKLSRRERELADLLQRHGRLPAPEPGETIPPDGAPNLSTAYDDRPAEERDASLAASGDGGPGGDES